MTVGRIVVSVTTQDRLEINWINTAGGALGAVSSAVVLSTLGAAGTLVGAAVGSLCISIGGAVYAHSMRKTKNRVAAVASGSGARKVRTPEHELATPSGRPADPQIADESPQKPDKDGLPWKRIAAMTAAVFAIAIAAIVIFESTTGRAVSTFTGGTSDTTVGSTFSGVTDSSGGGGDSSDGDTEDGYSNEGDEAPAEDEQFNEEPVEEQQDEAPAQDQAPVEEAPVDEAPAQGAPAVEVEPVG